MLGATGDATSCTGCDGRGGAAVAWRDVMDSQPEAVAAMSGLPSTVTVIRNG
jgi:hypothetical protein